MRLTAYTKRLDRFTRPLYFSSEPFVGYPNRWADPVFQPWLFDYDVQKKVDKALSALNTDCDDVRASAGAST